MCMYSYSTMAPLCVCICMCVCVCVAYVCRQVLVCCSYVQVPLRIELKSEQKYEEMVDILGSLHKYVPRVPTTEMVEVAGCEEPVKVTKSNFFNIGLGKLQCLYFRETSYM